MSEPDMKIDPARASTLVSQLKSVSDRVAAVAKGRNVRLVAVSKLRPANDILALQQQASHVHFGENYSQELQQKAELLPRSIQWHFIGGLQSGHCKNLAKIPNLFCVSSVDTQKKAQLLDEHRGKLLASFSSSATTGEDATNAAAADASSSGSKPGKLNVHVQVNTSGEESKSGCQPGDETLSLCKFIASDETCPNLNLLGLMTIGAIARSVATTPENENEDFVLLRQQRDLVAKELGLADPEELELSMGMSEDFEGAIALGSGEVRVGSTIFGERGPKSEAKIVA